MLIHAPNTALIAGHLVGRVARRRRRCRHHADAARARACSASSTRRRSRTPSSTPHCATEFEAARAARPRAEAAIVGDRRSRSSACRSAERLFTACCHRRRRSGADRLHIRHHRQAQRLRPFPSRYRGDGGDVFASYPAAKADGRLHAARRHSRSHSGWALASCFPPPSARRPRSATKARLRRARRHHRRTQSHDALHLAHRLSRADEARPTQSSPRCTPASPPASTCRARHRTNGSSAPASASSTASAPPR